MPALIGYVGALLVLTTAALAIFAVLISQFSFEGCGQAARSTPCTSGLSPSTMLAMALVGLSSLAAAVAWAIRRSADGRSFWWVPLVLLVPVALCCVVCLRLVSSATQ